VQIQIHNVRSRLVDFSNEDLQKIRRDLSTYAPGFKYTKLFKNKQWDGRVSLLQNEEIPTGLVHLVVEKFPNVNIVDFRNITTPQLHQTSVPLRDYQWEAVRESFENTLYGGWFPRGVVKVPTAGGKTIIAAAMVEMTQVKTIFLVHRRELVNQTIDKFKKYGIHAGKISEGNLELDQQVTIATIQSLMSFKHKTNKTKNRTQEQVINIDRKKAEKGKVIRKFLMGIEQVFIDEAHLTASTVDKGNLFTQALDLMPNAYMRWGLTATPFMRDQYHNWLLEGVTGPILYEIKSQELVEEGYLAKPNITMYRNKVKSYGDWNTDYDYGIVMNDARNDKVIKCIQNKPGPIMVLIQRIAHGNLLQHLCAKANIPVRFLYGDISVDDRKLALFDLKAGSIKAIIASTIWDEGIDIEEIRTLILAGAGKSKIKNLQRLGRGLRITEDKQEVEVIDFFEEGSKWLRSHAMQRRRLWESEGFPVELS